MKKILMLGAMALLVWYFWIADDKPEFTGPGGYWHEAVWEWEHANGEKEKFEAAQKIYVLNATAEIGLLSNAVEEKFNEMRSKVRAFIKKDPQSDAEDAPHQPTSQESDSNSSPQLTDDQMALVSEANEYFRRILAAASEFELGLTPDEVRQVTQDNPDSVFLRTGVFYLNTQVSSCPKAEFNRLKAKYTAEELFVRGRLVGAINYERERTHRENYLLRLMELIEEDEEKLNEHRVLAELLYPSQLRVAQGQKDEHESIESSGFGLKQLEELLIETGIERSKLNDYLQNLAELSPKCMWVANQDFFNLVRTEFILEAGETILRALKDQVRREGRLPNSILELRGDAEDLLYKEHGTGYYIKHGGSFIELYADGDDRQESTSDDVFIGRISL